MYLPVCRRGLATWLHRDDTGWRSLLHYLNLENERPTPPGLRALFVASANSYGGIIFFLRLRLW